MPTQKRLRRHDQPVSAPLRKHAGERDVSGAQVRLAAADDQEPVEALASERAYPRFGIRVCVRRADRRSDDLDALALEDGIEAPLNLLSRSWIRRRNGSRRSATVMSKLRACRATQRPSGFAVQRSVRNARFPPPLFA